jgi:hypothetical protein
VVIHPILCDQSAIRTSWYWHRVSKTSIKMKASGTWSICPNLTLSVLVKLAVPKFLYISNTLNLNFFECSTHAHWIKWGASVGTLVHQVPEEKSNQIKRKNTPLFTTRQHVSRAPTWQRRRNNTGFTLPFEMQIWYAVWYGYSLEVSANLIWLHSMTNVLSTTPKRSFAHVLQNSWPVCQRPPQS